VRKNSWRSDHIRHECVDDDIFVAHPRSLALGVDVAMDASSRYGGVVEHEFSLTRFRYPLVLTGAGISAESDLPTFRGTDGLWEGHRINDVATPEAFERDPRRVWTFYSMRREAAFRARPNRAHEALARFAAAHPDFVLVTQNVDGLHERAHESVGAPMPWAMHGRLEVTRCSRCDRTWSDRRRYFDGSGNPLPESGEDIVATTGPDPLPAPARDSEGIPRSNCCGARLRPDIVWFGEIPYFLDAIAEALERCDVFVAIGTSGQVYPAAGFLAAARSRGVPTAVLCAEPPANLDRRDRYFEGAATRWVPVLCGENGSGGGCVPHPISWTGYWS
jgi:NAD-dependent deacetylase